MTAADVTEITSFQPKDIHTLEDTGLPYSLLFDLLLKHAYFEGIATLAKRLKLNSAVIHPIFRHWQREQLCSTRSMVGNDYEIALTTRGREMAELALKKGHYAGPAPVPIADYNRAVSQQGIRVRITAATLESALRDLIVSDELIQRLGAALVTGGAILFYGGTGNGKTSIAERLNRIFSDLVFVPHAVEISGHIVSVFDPLIHRAEEADTGPNDARWGALQAAGRESRR